MYAKHWHSDNTVSIVSYFPPLFRLTRHSPSLRKAFRSNPHPIFSTCMQNDNFTQKTQLYPTERERERERKREREYQEIILINLVHHKLLFPTTPMRREKHWLSKTNPSKEKWKVLPKQGVVYMCSYFCSMQCEFDLPEWCHECILKFERFSPVGLVFMSPFLSFYNLLSITVWSILPLKYQSLITNPRKL